MYRISRIPGHNTVGRVTSLRLAQQVAQNHAGMPLAWTQTDAVTWVSVPRYYTINLED